MVTICYNRGMNVHVTLIIFVASSVCHTALVLPVVKEMPVSYALGTYGVAFVAVGVHVLAMRWYTPRSTLRHVARYIGSQLYQTGAAPDPEDVMKMISKGIDREFMWFGIAWNVPLAVSGFIWAFSDNVIAEWVGAAIVLVSVGFIVRDVRRGW